ncbi:MAG: VIT family protein [Sporolactobacillus sp.]
MTKKDKSRQTMEQKLNVLRAGVLGSNDGILTVVGVLFSVGAATTNSFTIFIAGLADLVACAFSMAAGEYASVSTQKDTEKVIVTKERQLNQTDADAQQYDICRYYEQKGVAVETAAAIAAELMANKPLESVMSVKHDIELGRYVSPWFAAVASLFAAGLAGCLPLLALTFLPPDIRWQGTIMTVILSVGLTGLLSAQLGHGFIKKAIVRNVIVGIVTMAIHFCVGRML